jgi:lipoate-protein ligase A
MQKAFKSKAVAINDISSRKIEMDEAKIAFREGFAEGLNIKLEPYTLTKDEMDYVIDLAKSKYESDEWNFKR